MTEEQRAQQRHEITEFRFALVAELVNPYLNPSQVSLLIRMKSLSEHQIPYIGTRRLSEAFIRKWMYAYKSHGKAGLEPKLRSDAGSCGSLSAEQQAILVTALEARPHLRAITVLAESMREGKITGEISSSSQT